MENDPFGRVYPESSSGNESDDTSSSKKKEKKDISKKSAKSEAPAEDKKTDTAHESLWSRVLGKTEEDTDKHTEKDETTDDRETTPESSEEDEAQIAPLETLGEAEQLEVAEAYIVARQAELLDEQASAAEDEDVATVEERRADISLLEAMRHLLARDQTGEQPLSEPVEEAYQSTVQTLGFAEFARSAPIPEDGLPEPETMPLPPVAVALRSGERATDVPEVLTYPVAEAEKKTTTTPETTETQEDTLQNRRKTGSALLVGGLVGYFIGRRRGRIKTEKQLKSVEATLTKQIERVQQTVVQKEQQIRRLAREVVEAKAPVPSLRVPERVTPKPEQKPVVRTEHLGLVTLKAIEAPLLRIHPETTGVAEKPEKKMQAPKKVESLSRPELLVAAAEVRVGATTLRQVFETNLITEQGLRRLMQEHERGGNVRAALEREIIEKETSYERDPRLRNRSVVGSLAASKLVRADIDKPTPAAQQASDDSSAAPGSTSQSVAKQRQSTQAQPAAVAAVATLVVVIAVLLVILFTSR